MLIFNMYRNNRNYLIGTEELMEILIHLRKFSGRICKKKKKKILLKLIKKLMLFFNTYKNNRNDTPDLKKRADGNSYAFKKHFWKNL